MVLGIDVNNLAVLVAAVVSMVVGFLWYGPLFGKTWMRLSGFSKEKLNQMKKKGMTKSYIMSFVLSLVTAYVLAGVIGLVGADTVASAALVGFWVWLGFFATQAASKVLWEGKSMGMFWLDGIGHLVNFVIISVILALW